MTFQYIGNDRYKIYLDRVPARSIRLHVDEINEIAEGCEVLEEAKEDLEILQDEHNDVLQDIKDLSKRIEYYLKLDSTQDIEDITEMLKDIKETISEHL